MTEQTPITHGGPNRCYKVCHCSKCSVVRECTPSFDFYTTDDELGPLVCETCFRPFVTAEINRLSNPKKD